MDETKYTLIIAIIGAVTGIIALIFHGINTWYTHNQTRVKLRVRPFWGVIEHGDRVSEVYLFIDIINIGSFPIYIQNFGFTERKKPIPCLIIVEFEVVDNVKLPIMIESRKSISIKVKPKGLKHNKLANIRYVYVLTQCGIHAFGTSKNFQKHLNEHVARNPA